jgi:hypothetical protein
MKTILNPFPVRSNTLQLADAAQMPGFAHDLPFVKMPQTPRLEFKKANGPGHRQLPHTTAVPRPAKVPVENPGNAQEETFNVAIKFARSGVRPRKSPKSGSAAGTTRVQPNPGQAGDSAL